MKSPIKFPQRLCFSTYHLSASSPPCLGAVASHCHHAAWISPPPPSLLPPGHRLRFATQSLLHLSPGSPRGQWPTPLAPHGDTIDPPSTHQKDKQSSSWTPRSKPYQLARSLIKTTASGSISLQWMQTAVWFPQTRCCRFYDTATRNGFLQATVSSLKAYVPSREPLDSCELVRELSSTVDGSRTFGTYMDQN